MPKKPTESASENIYQLKITLRDSKPPIWRRIEVPADFTLMQLHAIMQMTMGWENYHMWEFVKDKIRYAHRNLQDDPERVEDVTEDAHEYRLSDVLVQIKDKMIYCYDFGDDWIHDILLEKKKSSEPNVTYPRCTAGKLATPPEDCGGMYGYYQLLEILADPSHDDYESMRDWIGDEFDPNHFDIDEINSELRLLNPQFTESLLVFMQCSQVKKQPKTQKEWFQEIAQAYHEAIVFQSNHNNPLEESSFYLAPYVCIKFRGLVIEDESVRRIVEETLACFTETMEEPQGMILDSSPILAFCYCYLVAHFAANLIDDKKLNRIMNHCVEKVDELRRLVEECESSESSR